MEFQHLLALSLKKLQKELEEDLNGKSLKKDITSRILIKKNTNIKCVISNREKIILCGVSFIKNFLRRTFPELRLKNFYKDGQNIKKNSIIFEINGNSKIIMAVERTILNFLQHLSSISTTTYKFRVKMGNVKTKLLNTRKTTIGIRKLEKFATVVGGAFNHRIGLYDQILIKDNHIKINGGIDKVLENLKSLKIKNYQIECENFADVQKSIKNGAKYILLDNMKPSEIKKCMKLKKSNIKFEITGGITFKNISNYSKLGADFISSSKITNSANSVDIGLDII